MGKTVKRVLKKICTNIKSEGTHFTTKHTPNFLTETSSPKPPSENMQHYNSKDFPPYPYFFSLFPEIKELLLKQK